MHTIALAETAALVIVIVLFVMERGSAAGQTRALALKRS